MDKIKKIKNCAKCILYKDICIIVNIQLSFKTFINVLRNSNSSKQLLFARIVNSITSKKYSSMNRDAQSADHIVNRNHMLNR